MGGEALVAADGAGAEAGAVGGAAAEGGAVEVVLAVDGAVAVEGGVWAWVAAAWVLPVTASRSPSAPIHLLPHTRPPFASVSALPWPPGSAHP